MKWPWSVTAKGFAMGVADLVPGVSGGTVAFIAGIYDPLLNSLSAISGEGFQALKRGQLIDAWHAINGRFLVALGAGIVLAISTLASPLHWLLEHEPVLLRAFFMGLVAMSVPLVGKHVGRWGADAWVWAAVGCAIAGFVTSKVSHFKLRLKVSRPRRAPVPKAAIFVTSKVFTASKTGA